jgi:hypothetical protein
MMRCSQIANENPAGARFRNERDSRRGGPSNTKLSDQLSHFY